MEYLIAAGKTFGLRESAVELSTFTVRINVLGFFNDVSSSHFNVLYRIDSSHPEPLNELYVAIATR